MRYTQTQRTEGRRYFSLFEFINTISFSFLAGNILTLLLLRLGAGDVLIGLFNSLIYASFFFMPIGRFLVNREGLIKNFGRAWKLRFVAMLPVLFVPIFLENEPVPAIIIVFTGYLFFQIFRGIGIVSVNPILKELSAGRDQGMFLSRLQIRVHGGATLANLIVALLIGTNGALWRYALSLGAGILLGFAGARAFVKIPEPPGYHPDSGNKPAALRQVLKQLLEGTTFKRYIPAFFAMIFFASMLRPFLPVLAKQVYLFDDSIVIFLTLISGLGSVAMGFINREMLDQLGAKPLMKLFTGLVVLTLFLAPLGPTLVDGWQLVILALMFFLASLGMSGGETSSQGYFFAASPPKNGVELGIIYYLIMGSAGALGSILGGVALDVSKHIVGGNDSDGFLLYFGFIALGLALTVLLISRMDGLKAQSMTKALSVLFSLRDWRAIALMKNLRRSRTLRQEQDMLQRIAELRSDLPVAELIERLHSPLFRIRREALSALAYLPFSRQVQDALIEQVEHNAFATSYQAARLLGQRGTRQAIPSLRKALDSPDRLLAGNAAAALAELGDAESLFRIQALALESADERFVIYAAIALRTYAELSSIPVLRTLAQKWADSSVVTEETAFAVGGILGLEDRIHLYYDKTSDKKSEVARELIEQLAGKHTEAFLEAYEKSGLLGLLELSAERPGILHNQAAEIAMHPVLGNLYPYRFLVVALCVQQVVSRQNIRQIQGDLSQK